MRRLWIAVALLCALFLAGIFNARYIKGLTHEVLAPLEQAQQMARQGDWQQALELTQQASQLWGAHQFYLHTTLRHTDLDEVSRGFRVVLAHLTLEEMDEYSAASADLMMQLFLLSETEQFTLSNIL